jgi:hypothetical protein
MPERKDTILKGAHMRSLNIRKRFIVFLIMMAAIPLAIVFFQNTGYASAPQKQAANPVMQEKWGIEITSIRLTANNSMVDFRYRVLDADKAGALFERQTKPHLIDQASGKVLAVPNTAKVGPLRCSNKPQEGRIYWMFFGNRVGLVKGGSKVTVVIGDFQAENLVVE